MIFNELLYPVFLFVSIFIFHLLPVNKRSWWIFFTGLLFYTYYADIFAALILAEALLVYALSKSCAKNKGAFLFLLFLSAGVLGWFKYRSMAAFTFDALIHFGHANHTNFAKLLLPLAISFFSFEFIHYIVDARNKKISPHTLDEFLAFAMFYPTMVAGPIKRFQHFVPQLKSARLTTEHLNIGIARILTGYAKKLIIADTMDLWVQPLLSRSGISAAGSMDAWIALLAYSIKIYADFSGYSDIAIGSARLFGITIPENFMLPYLKQNIGLFWRSWHISLMQWLMDYVYIPLGGNKKGLRRTCINTMAALFISGLWHGAAWHFVVWGLYHGVLLVLYRLYAERVKPKIKFLQTPNPVVRAFSVCFTFVLVTVGWGLFIMPVDDFLTLLPKLLFMKG